MVPTPVRCTRFSTLSFGGKSTPGSPTKLYSWPHACSIAKKPKSSAVSQKRVSITAASTAGCNQPWRPWLPKKMDNRKSVQIQRESLVLIQASLCIWLGCHGGTHCLCELSAAQGTGHLLCTTRRQSFALTLTAGVGLDCPDGMMSGGTSRLGFLERRGIEIALTKPNQERTEVVTRICPIRS